MNLTPFQYHVLHEIGVWHGRASNHMIWEYVGVGHEPYETALSACRKLESEGLVEQSMPGKTASKWKLTKLGEQVLAEHNESKDDPS